MKSIIQEKNDIRDDFSEDRDDDGLELDLSDEDDEDFTRSDANKIFDTDAAEDLIKDEIEF